MHRQLIGKANTSETAWGSLILFERRNSASYIYMFLQRQTNGFIWGKHDKQTQNIDSDQNIFSPVIKDHATHFTSCQYFTLNI